MQQTVDFAVVLVYIANSVKFTQARAEQNIFKQLNCITQPNFWNPHNSPYWHALHWNHKIALVRGEITRQMASDYF